MKIYSNRRDYKYWFEKYVGKDMWVRVMHPGVGPVFIRFLNYENDIITFKYITPYLSKHEALYHITEDSECQKSKSSSFLARFVPQDTVMAYTTDEIIEIVEELF